MPNNETKITNQQNIKTISNNYDLLNSREKLRNIRDNIESYYIKWGLKKEAKIIKSIRELKIRLFLLNSIQWTNRAASVAGGSLIFIGNGDNNSPYTKIGGVLAITSPFVETVVSLAKTSLFDDEKKKLEEFLEGAAKEIWDLYFQYSKLEEILIPIKNIGSGLPENLNKALSSAEQRVKYFLPESYEILAKAEQGTKEKAEHERKNINLKQELREAEKKEDSSSKIEQIKQQIEENNKGLEIDAEKRDKFPLRLWEHWEIYKNWLLEGGVELEEGSEKVKKESIKKVVENLLKELDNYLYAKDHTVINLNNAEQDPITQIEMPPKNN